ncbi:peptidoglycan editing factor PgeF [Piscinibacter sp.]|uniref:peptidoglycan editing factor PgeF n=1 Tax=Piscinibacter sp. TaxID=1903157 RepID=UPI0039E43246
MAGAHPDWLRPDWSAPGVGALMSTRAGGVSEGPFASLNLRDGLGDDPAAVARNQAIFAAAIGARPVWLNQVHGATVVRLAAKGEPVSVRAELVEAPSRSSGTLRQAQGGQVQAADASVCTEPGIACAVQVADCLPVLFAAPRGVAAAHAGWRGLAGGVLEASVAALCEAAACAPGEVQAWLGPCIGPRRFEVGADVRQAFAGDEAFFTPLGAGKWLADLPGLARARLRRAGVERVGGGRWCSVEDASRFFSFRRDRVTGRMAAAVWLERRA